VDKDEAMPMRVPAAAYQRLRQLVSKVAREGWRSVGCPDRDDPPTLGAVLGEALEQFEDQHYSESGLLERAGKITPREKRALRALAHKR
jgi:hypothetical protein